MASGHAGLNSSNFTLLRGVLVGQPNPEVSKDQLSLIFNSWLLYEMLHIFVYWECRAEQNVRGTISLVTTEAEAPIGLVRRIGAAKR